MTGITFETWMQWLGRFVAGVGVFCLVRFVWGDRARGRRRCPRCWYDMSGGGINAGLICPECGHDAKRQKRLLKTRRRTRWVVLGLVVMVAASFVHRVDDARQRGWAGLVPTFALATMLPWLHVEQSHVTALASAGTGGWKFGEWIGARNKELDEELRTRFKDFGEWSAFDRQLLLRVAWLTRGPLEDQQPFRKHAVYSDIIAWCMREPFPDGWYIESMLREAASTRDVWVEGYPVVVWGEASSFAGFGHSARLVIRDLEDRELGSDFAHSFMTMVSPMPVWFTGTAEAVVPSSDGNSTEERVVLELISYSSERDADGKYSEIEHTVAEVVVPLRFDRVRSVDDLLTKIDGEHIDEFFQQWVSAIEVRNGVGYFSMYSRDRGHHDSLENFLAGLGEGGGFGLRAEMLQDGKPVAYTTAWHRHGGFYEIAVSAFLGRSIIVEPSDWMSYLFQINEASEYSSFHAWFSQASFDSSYEIRLSGDPIVSLTDRHAQTYWDGSVSVELKLVMDGARGRILVGPDHQLWPGD